MKRLALTVLASTVLVAAVGIAHAQEDAGSTTEKLPAASGAPAAAPASPEPAPTPESHHGAHTGTDASDAGPQAATTKPAADGKITVDTGEVAFDMPAAWKSVPPANMMRKAQVVIPKIAGDPEDGEIAISFFPGGGGGLEANVSRWYGQFETADGKPVNDTAKREQLKAGALDVTYLDVGGTMKASGMPGMGSPVDRKDWHLLGGIVMTPGGPWFFKATGPEKTIAASRDAFKALLASVKSK